MRHVLDHLRVRHQPRAERPDDQAEHDVRDQHRLTREQGEGGQNGRAREDQENREDDVGSQGSVFISPGDRILAVGGHEMNVGV